MKTKSIKKSLTEVWEWKDAVGREYAELKDLSFEERHRILAERTAAMLRAHGIELKQPEQSDS